MMSIPICAYCGETRLTGNDPVEHPIPHALGSSLEIATVCDACNRRANREIDQPFLRDHLVMIHRSMLDIRDPRRPEKRLPNPLLSGTDYRGVRVTNDENNKPRFGGRIITDPDDPSRTYIYASSIEEGEHLKERVFRRAEAEGQRAELVSVESRQERPRITTTIKMDMVLWLRAAAKMALGIASAAYEPDWRLSDDASRLREMMWSKRLPEDDDGRTRGFFPMSVEEAGLQLVVEPPAHAAWFVANTDDETTLIIVLFGEFLMPFTVDRSRRPVPLVAWLLDPHKPTASGHTTWDSLLREAVVRSKSHLPADSA